MFAHSLLILILTIIYFVFRLCFYDSLRLGSSKNEIYGYLRIFYPLSVDWIMKSGCYLTEWSETPEK